MRSNLAFDPDLPDELRGEDDEPGYGAGDGEAGPVDREGLLAALGLKIAEGRDKAVEARRASGIEEVWAACEAAYVCMDELNRHEFVNSKWVKPMAMTGPVQTNTSGPPEVGRSTAFVRLTARYVDMAASKVAEIVLPIDDKAFSFKPTPVPDPINPVPPQAASPAQLGLPGDPAAPQQAPMQVPQPAPPAPDAGMGAMPQPAPGQMTQVAQAAGEAANDPQSEFLAAAAGRAEKRVYDWMVEAKYPAEMRKMLFNAARLGVGILKGPYPDRREKRAISRKETVGADGVKRVVISLSTKVEVVPGFRSVDPWHFFPHDSCGEDVHNGEHTLERDYVSATQLKRLKLETDQGGEPVYLGSAIDKVIEQGPDGHREAVRGKQLREHEKRSRFEIWYFTGVVSLADLQAAGAVLDPDLPEELGEMSAIVTMVNNTVIRATPNPSPMGKSPYRVMPWSPREGSWAGIGVAEQVSMAQKTVNASVRAIFNNAGVSGGCQIVIDEKSIKPADQSMVITPNKVWYMTSEAPDPDVRKMFAAVEFPNITPQLMPILDMGFKMAEEASNIPLISQGQTGPQDVQTFGQAELQNSNANTLLRNVAYRLDDNVTEPTVNECYDWLLMDDTVPDDEKGDWQINARGSITMVEKYVQEQTLLAMAAIVVNPAFDLSPPRWAEEMLRAKRIDPRKLQLTAAEKQAISQRPQPEPPQVMAAKIGAASREKVAEMTAGVTKERIAKDTDRDAIYADIQASRDKNDHQATIAELQLRRELAILDYATKRDMQVEDVKARLTETAIKVDLQRDLSLAGHIKDIDQHRNPAPPQVVTPPTEPAGRADPGHAFEE